MKNSIFLIGFIMALTACHNKNVNMSEYSNSDKTITCKLPSYMRLTKESKYLIMFAGNQKIARIIWALSENDGHWDMERSAEQMLGKNKSKLTLVEQNDSLIAYEARSGNISLPASVFSLHEISGYSVLLFTMGFTVESHLSISDSIRCKPVKKKNEFKTGTTTYDGEYINLEYPSHWEIDNSLNFLTSDVYIRQPDRTFGVQLFRFEREDSTTFHDDMTQLVNSWRETSNVDMSYETINGKKWCRHDIQTNSLEMVIQQISYYCWKDCYIYNVRFTHLKDSVTDITQYNTTIKEIMSSVIIK